MAMGRPRTDLRTRFSAYVEKIPFVECWIWSGPSDKKGYGRLKVAPGRALSAHRVSWEMANGPIPKGRGYHGTCVLHRCDNPPCVNPAHLFLGTSGDNMADKTQKGRQSKGDGFINSKLTAVAVREILASVETGVTLARRFGVKPPAISKVRRGHGWKHVKTESQVEG
jgi:hypothetical protein